MLIHASPLNFYPRPPCGGRPGCSIRWGASTPFLSTSPLRGTTIDPLCDQIQEELFLSTSPLRGTTWWRCRSCPPPCHFYPRPPCGGRRFAFAELGADIVFLSTSPLRGTTPGFGHVGNISCISIHVPLAGDDRWRSRSYPRTHDFYPRPPCGGRLLPRGSCASRPYFYPRPPCGGRLAGFTVVDMTLKFLSTSPLRGTTGQRAEQLHFVLAFLSTSPLRGTTSSAGSPC